MLSIKRVYEAPSAADGCRILTDRLWPRGLSKEKAKVDVWAKDIAPSGSLRKWFGHDPAKWGEFQKRYRAELRANPAAMDEMRRLVAQRRNVTLVFGAKDVEHNEAAVLRDILADA